MEINYANKKNSQKVFTGNNDNRMFINELTFSIYVHKFELISTISKCKYHKLYTFLS